MNNSTSEILKNAIPEIMSTWEKRVLVEIDAANLQGTLALRNSLPVYLTQLVDALSTTIDRTSARKNFDKEASTRIGQKHGRERANAASYTMDQMIMEYHVLRQVIFDVMEEKTKLTSFEYEVIICSVEQAVNDAATEFSKTLKDLQEQLSQTLAHDLRTPISAAKMNAELMIRKPDTDPFYILKSSRIVSNLNRVDKMISDLLDVSRLRAGQKLPLEFAECSLNAIAKSVAEEFDPENGNTIKIDSKCECVGNWNEDGIRRVLENLVNNAVKYGKENATVTIALGQDDSKAFLKVHNEGEAISAEDQATLFEQYKRARSAEIKSGWGLGLTMVKGMAEAHGGQVLVKSEEGFGTTFTVELPLNSKTPEL